MQNRCGGILIPDGFPQPPENTRIQMIQNKPLDGHGVKVRASLAVVFVHEINSPSDRDLRWLMSSHKKVRSYDSGIDC
jgi:hypothetical protein